MLLNPFWAFKAAAAGGAIAFVQDIEFNGVNVASVNATLNGVGGGNLLVCADAVFRSGGADPANDVLVDTQTNTWNTTTAPTAQGNTNAFINYAMNVAAGNTTVTVDHGADALYITGGFLEFSGALTAAALDQQASDTQSADSTPTVGPTGTTGVASEAVIVCLAISSAVNPAGIDVPATTDYTNTQFIDDNSGNQAGSVDYKVVSSTGTQDAAWGTLGGTHGWISKIATFKAA